MRARDSLVVSVTVTNTGTRDGTEVAQLYMRHDAASVTRPVRELRGFQRVALRAGEARTLRFALQPASFAMYDSDMRRVVESGAYTLWAGGSSDATLASHVAITGATLVLAPPPPRIR